MHNAIVDPHQTTREKVCQRGRIKLPDKGRAIRSEPEQCFVAGHCHSRVCVGRHFSMGCSGPESNAFPEFFREPFRLDNVWPGRDPLQHDQHNDQHDEHSLTPSGDKQLWDAFPVESSGPPNYCPGIFQPGRNSDQA